MLNVNANSERSTYRVTPRLPSEWLEAEDGERYGLTIDLVASFKRFDRTR